MNKTRRLIIKILPTLILAVIFLAAAAPYYASATEGSSMLEKMKKSAQTGGYNTEGKSETALAEVVGKVIGAFLALLGVVFIAMIMMAGYHWMIASGNDQKINEAKDELKHATIGLIITMASYAIWNFIWFYLAEGT